MAPRSKDTTPPQNNIPHEMNENENRNDNNPMTNEDGPETTDIAGAWADAEGYTPLSDLNNDEGISGRNSYVMISTGPIDSSDSDNDDDNCQEGDARQGSFCVNQNVFGNTNGVDISPTVNSSVEDYNFDEIIANALSALDEEYQHTIVRPQTEPSNEMEEDEDLKIIAAGFDEREKELKQINEQGGFVARWDELEAKSSISLLKNNDKEQQRRTDVDVDTDAVRRAIKNLSVKNKDAPFQRKFSIWQHNQLLNRQQQDNQKHQLIPMTSYKVFEVPNPTAKSRLASANLSRSATLAEALARLSLLSSFQDDLLLIDIVGVDHVECESTSTIRNTFRPFVQWLGDYFLASQEDKNIHVHFRLIGRELFTTTTKEKVVVDLLDSSSTQSSFMQATATCHSEVYHNFLEATCRRGVESSEHDDVDLLSSKTFPDLAVLFNAGIWGYREWVDTIQYLALQQYAKTTIPVIEAGAKNRSRCGLPIVITAYTLDECQEDQEVISQSITSRRGGNKNTTKSCDSYRAEILWASEKNPFGSQIVRETKGSTQEYRENACWQAWLLGGKTS